MSQVLSADWVLPVEGPPIECGAVAIEDGRVVGVGSAAGLGEGIHYEDSVISERTGQAFLSGGRGPLLGLGAARRRPADRVRRGRDRGREDRRGGLGS